MMSDDWWWTPSCDANLLALGLARQIPRPALSFDIINTKFAAFERTYLNLLELLRRDDKSIAVLDALTHPSLLQTHDEYEDFKSDADTLHRGMGAFSKRNLSIPLPYKVARYIYTDADILQLNNKINWQIRIMDGKMDDMVLSHFVLVHKRYQVTRSHDNHGLGLLARSSQDPHDLRMTGLHSRQNNDDGDILHLWERVDRLGDILDWTSSHLQPQINSNETPPTLNAEDFSRVFESLKARFKKTADAKVSHKFNSITEDQLAAHSEKRLKHLLNSFPDFVTRKRVYDKDELNSIHDVPRVKSEQNHAHVPASVATVKIIPLGMTIDLLFLDVVEFKHETVIVCTDMNKQIGVLHYRKLVQTVCHKIIVVIVVVPLRFVIYPATNTRRVDALNHDREVFVKENCVVNITGGKRYSAQSALAMYNFSHNADMYALQSALRGKLIRHAFDVDEIESIHGLVTTHQHLKIWSDFNNENYTLSFYVKRKTGHETDLEFPVECFLPNPTPSQDAKKPQMIRLYFRLQPPQPPKSKPSSRDSTKEAHSPPTAALPMTGGGLFSRKRLNSTEMSPPQPKYKIFSKIRRASDTPTLLSLSLPAGRTDQRSSSSFGSLETQPTNNTTAMSAVSASSSSTSGVVSNVHPDAETMQYLDIKFSITSDAAVFTTAFQNATIPMRKYGHFRGQSIYGEPHRRTEGSMNEPVTIGNIATSPGPVSTGGITASDLQDLTLPPAMGSPARSEQGSRILFGDQPGPEAFVSKQAIAVVGHQTSNRDSLSNLATIASDVVYRVRGIPMRCQVDKLKIFMASQFEIDQSGIEVRSLATNPDGKSQTAIVTFDTVPFELSTQERNWFFKWRFTKGKNASHVKIDSHFNGLTMLYTPPKNLKHEIDICAVAMGDSAFEAFEKKEKGGSYMWVLDLLQDYFGSARIMLYSCHSNSSKKRSSGMIENLAQELLESMNDLDDDGESEPSSSDLDHDRVGNVPLIFIGYSLAGQVIKQAMVQTEEDNFYNSVAGALFFGVPSSTIEADALEAILGDDAESFWDMTDQKTAHVLNDKFNMVIKRKGLNMQYFYETERDTQPTKGKAVDNTSLVVPPSSATNFLISDHPTKLPKNVHAIQRDHLGLVKWRAHDPECPMVIRAMKTMKTKALAKQNRQPSPSASPPDLAGRAAFAQLSRRQTDHSTSPRSEAGFPQASRTSTGLSSQRTMPPETGRGPISTKDYHVGWICAVGPEYVAALQLLDERLSRPFDLSTDDENAYSFGIIGDHHVVIAGLAQGKYGTTSATSTATDMQRSFRSIRIGLMVGIAGGAPSTKRDIRLGDVVVSTPQGQRGGVFRYDSGRTIQNKEFVITGSLNSPPEFLLKALMKLSSLHRSDGHQIKLIVENMLEKNPRLRNEYQKPDADTDVLYASSFIHANHDQSCAESCFSHKDRIVSRDRRSVTEDDPVVHFGLIASGDRLMKDAVVRDALIEKEEVLCFEMEAAGLMGRFPCLVIRGICDYSDTHKNDLWQGYAAATAAAYAKELLLLALDGRKIREEVDTTALFEMEEDVDVS